MMLIQGLSWIPRWLIGKESVCSTEDSGSVPGLKRSPAGGNGNPLQYSCLENFIDRGSLVDYSPWDPKESDMTECTRTRVVLWLSPTFYLVALPSRRDPGIEFILLRGFSVFDILLPWSLPVTLADPRKGWAHPRYTLFRVVEDEIKYYMKMSWAQQHLRIADVIQI